MVKFQTLDLKVIPNNRGRYGTLHGRVDVQGEWRARPKGKRLFTPAKIRKIRESYARGEYMTDIAHRFDCSKVLIYHIVNGSIYRDVV